MNLKPLFTAVATATGGRNGRAATEDGLLSVELSAPQAMAGPRKGAAATPEHLFACGYAASFGGALDYVASRAGMHVKTASVTCSVSIGRQAGGGLALAVRLHVVDAKIPQVELEALALVAHEKICPYSHATRGNVQVELTVDGA